MELEATEEGEIFFINVVLGDVEEDPVGEKPEEVRCPIDYLKP
jgi:hypothetical protein